MTSSIHKLLWLYEFPEKIPEMMKQGYSHFGFESVGIKQRVLVRAWKDVKIVGHFECKGTHTQECEKRFFANPVALDLHQRAKGHGKYQSLKIPA